MEDLPSIETLNLTRVKVTEAMNYLNRIASIRPAFLSPLVCEIENLDRDELRDLANEYGLVIFEMAGGFEITIVKDHYKLTLWGK